MTYVCGQFQKVLGFWRGLKMTEYLCNIVVTVLFFSFLQFHLERGILQHWRFSHNALGSDVQVVSCDVGFPVWDTFLLLQNVDDTDKPGEPVCLRHSPPAAAALL